MPPRTKQAHIELLNRRLSAAENELESERLQHKTDADSATRLMASWAAIKKEDAALIARLKKTIVLLEQEIESLLPSGKV